MVPALCAQGRVTQSLVHPHDKSPPYPHPAPWGRRQPHRQGRPRSLGRRRQAWLSHRVGQPKCKGISHEYVPRVTRSQHRANPVPPVKKNCSEPAADSADSADGANGADGADGAFHSRARHGGRPGGAGGPRGCCVQNREESQRSPQQNWTPRLVTVRWGQSPRLSRLTAQGPAGHTPGHQSGEGGGERPVKSRCQPRPRAPGSAGLRGCGGPGLCISKKFAGRWAGQDSRPSTDTQSAWTARDARC